MFCSYRTNHIFAENFVLNEVDKIELIEEMSSHYMQSYHLPPLPANILSYFLVDQNEEGYTFDELVEIFNASKSSISNSLNLLIQYNYIGQHTKFGERKRRYKIMTEHLIVRLKKIRTDLKQERYLVDKLMKFRLNCTENVAKYKAEKIEIYLDHLQNSIDKLSETVEKLEKLTQK